MIKNNENQVELKFGKGDIHIVSSCTTDGEMGIVAFENQDPPKPIGKNSKTFIKKFIPEDYPIIMTFSKTESIDALINELLNAKENMIRFSK